MLPPPPSSSLAANPVAPPPGVFVYATQTHFDDLDALWVLHHSRFLLFVERAQQALFDQTMATEAFDPARYPDLYVVVRRIEADYRRPLRGVVPFHVWLWVERVREAALTVGFRFVDPAGGPFFAEGKRTVCKLSGTTHQPASWSADFRARYEALAAEWAAGPGLPR